MPSLVFCWFSNPENCWVTNFNGLTNSFLLIGQYKNENSTVYFQSTIYDNVLIFRRLVARSSVGSLWPSECLQPCPPLLILTSTCFFPIVIQQIRLSHHGCDERLRLLCLLLNLFDTGQVTIDAIIITSHTGHKTAGYTYDEKQCACELFLYIIIYNIQTADTVYSLSIEIKKGRLLHWPSLKVLWAADKLSPGCGHFACHARLLATPLLAQTMTAALGYPPPCTDYDSITDSFFRVPVLLSAFLWRVPSWLVRMARVTGLRDVWTERECPFFQRGVKGSVRSFSMVWNWKGVSVLSAWCETERECPFFQRGELIRIVCAGSLLVNISIRKYYYYMIL